ncbi:MAG: DUF4407 domain-containing protein [Sphingobacteriia bacterium]|nr:DUF4407 domain-containing protein [Sphingobacteriia bacterium]
MEQNMSLLSAESYVPTRWERISWWMATADTTILKDCAVDRGRYTIVGYCVAATWLFATLAWSYFFSTVVSNVLVAILLGIFMGGMILMIDRALIKGISSSNKRKIFPLTFRIALALTIGTFMAQPALLYLFDKEIHTQISIDNEQKKKQKAVELANANAVVVTGLQTERNRLQAQLNELHTQVTAARNSFIAETDGTGGSKKIGLKDIAKAKQDAYLKLDAEYSTMAKSVLPQIQQKDSLLNIIQQQSLLEQKQFEQLLHDGFLTRIEALNNLTAHNNALQFRYYLLIIILVLIELLPVLSKTFLPSGSYEQRIALTEQNEKLLIKQLFNQQLKLHQLKSQLAFEADSSISKEYFANTETLSKEKSNDLIQNWKQQNISKKELWNLLKKDLMME